MPRTTENKVVTKGCGLTEEMWPQVDAAADKVGMNRNQWMRWAIGVALAEFSDNPPPVLEKVVAVKASRSRKKAEGTEEAPSSESTDGGGE